MIRTSLLIHDVRLADGNLRIPHRSTNFGFMSVGESNYLREIIPAMRSYGRQILAENQGNKPHLVIYGHGTSNQDGMIFCNENLDWLTVDLFQAIEGIFQTILLSGCSVVGNRRGSQMCSRLSRLTGSEVFAPTLTQFGGVNVVTSTDWSSPQANLCSILTVRFDGPFYRFTPPFGNRANCLGSSCVPPILVPPRQVPI
jgi:hypothetical protein